MYPIFRHLLKENRKLTDIVHAETEKRKRLTFQNEELLWKLKRSSQVAKTLAVFNSSQSKEHSGEYLELDSMGMNFVGFYTEH